ncbi:protein dehydratase [Trabulsiella odontotermitis]|uniref:protein dehydratase n=1 Tax=Trabulsiella odontotermitis TaxID=379893 RepID=UPI003AD64A48
MTPLHYTLEDAHRWAAFSGDYNPVHFDEAWVKAQGGTALSVHGMLALLDVKRALSHEVGSAPFLNCTVRLRRPLLHDTTYLLTHDSARKGAAVVTDVLAGQVFLTGQLIPQTHFPPSAVTHRTVLKSATLAALQEAFAPLLPAAQQWHFLDALLFRHLIQDNSLLRQDVIATILPHCDKLASLLSCYPVVQTHQEVIFDSHLLAPWQADTRPGALEIETLPALVVGDLQHGAIVRLASQTRFLHHNISSAITLKVGPTGAP